MFHPFVGIKILLLGLWFFYPEPAVLLLLSLYGGETVLFANALRKGVLLLPVFTRKIIVLTFSVLAVQGLFLAGVIVLFPQSLFFSLLFFDLFSLLVGSAVVLLWQPVTVFWRKRILAKAKEKRKKLQNLKVVGITGSYGKTSTKEFLTHILGKKFVVLKTPEHKNSEMGISHTILYDLVDEHQIFVCEMGAYNRGGIKLLADIVQPTLGIVTGINEQHLATFGSGMNLFSAEGGGELVQALPQDGTLILNDDSKQLHELGLWLQLWNPEFANYIWCSTKTQKDFFAKDIVVEKEKVSFVMSSQKGDTAEIKVSMAGGQSIIENILLAAAAASKLGMSLSEIAEALKDAPVQAGALRLKKGKNDIDIIDSSYSANPSGVVAALEYLQLWEGKKIVVMPSLIELGKASYQVHVEIGRKIGETCDYAIITTKDQFAALQRGATEKGMKEDHLLFLENPQEVVSHIGKWTKKGDVVLLEGRVPKQLIVLLTKT